MSEGIALVGEGLRLWTVYQPGAHPYPTGHYAVEFIVRGEEAVPTGAVIEGALELIRRQMTLLGLYCLSRAEQDHPSIVETWL